MCYEPKWVTEILEKQNLLQNGNLDMQGNMKPHDGELWQKWGSNEKDEIRKLLLNFGFGRWERI